MARNSFKLKETKKKRMWLMSSPFFIMSFPNSRIIAYLCEGESAPLEVVLELAPVFHLHNYKIMKIISSPVFSFLCVLTVALPVAAARPAPDYVQLAEEVAEREWQRRGDGAAACDLPTALWGNACLRLFEVTGDSLHFHRAASIADELVGEDGKVRGHDLTAYDLECLSMGAFLYNFYQHNKGGEKYLNAQVLLRKQLHTQPRMPNRIFCMSKAQQDVVNLKSFFSVMPFYCMYAAMFDEERVFGDIILQFLLIEECTADPSTGLNYATCGGKKTDERVLASEDMGYYMMALVDLLDYFPWGYPFRGNAVETLDRLTENLLECQPKKFGLWPRVPVTPVAPSNPDDLIASTMFIYSIAKGVNKRYLQKKHLKPVVKTFDLLVQRSRSDNPIEAACFILAALELEEAKNNK